MRIFPGTPFCSNSFKIIDRDSNPLSVINATLIKNSSHRLNSCSKETRTFFPCLQSLYTNSGLYAKFELFDPSTNAVDKPNINSCDFE